MTDFVDVLEKGLSVPAVEAIHSFNNNDSTKMYNDSIKDVLQKGIYKGGRLKPGGILKVLIEPFVAKTTEGQTLRNDLKNTEVELPKTGDVYMICIYNKYLPNSKPIIKTIAIPSDQYTDHPDRDYLICFGMCDLTGGSETVFESNLSEVGRDNGPFLEGVEQLNTAIDISSMLDSFANSIYREAIVESFNTEEYINLDMTNMFWNSTLRAYFSKGAKEAVETINLLPLNYPKQIDELVVFVDTDDDAPTVQIKTQSSAAWQDVATNAYVTITNPGNELFFRFKTSDKNMRINNFTILFDRIPDLPKVDSDINDGLDVTKLSHPLKLGDL